MIEVEPLTAKTGAIIHGADLTRPVSDELFSEIHEAWLQHLVVFFRDQPMSPEQHLQFGRKFGELHIHPAAPFAHDNPALMVIHADKDSSRNNGEGWHSDVSADEEPPKASILHIQKTPSQGGDTLWSNMYMAYDTLSQPIKTMLEGLTALHVSDFSGFYGAHKPQRVSPSAKHPVVRTHPETGIKALYVNSGFTRRISGISGAESQALLGLLFEHVKNPNFQCRFQWRDDSVAVWDNRCTQHMAVWDYFPESRSGIRVAVKGDRPYFKGISD